MQDRAAIDVADLERATPRMRPGDIVLIDTGWWRYVNTERYEEHPYLTGEAAEWLVAQGAKIVGIDSSTPDQAVHYRPKDFAFPVHHTLLSNGVLIAEHLTNLSGLAGRRVEIMFLGINIAGSDGAPARPVARALQ
jgi:kynurenine formamidase